MSQNNNHLKNNLHNETLKQWSELILSFLVLCLLILYSYTLVFLRPYIGFYLNQNNGQVSMVNEEARRYIQEGDIILAINGVSPQDFNQSTQNNPTIQTKVGETLHIELERDGKISSIDMPKPDRSNLGFLDLLTGSWVIPYPFFGAGLITILFIRPRSKTRTLLYLFFYCFAIWVSAGQISSFGYWAANTIMRIFIWLSVPIAVNLHWLFPTPFRPMKKWVSVAVYGIPISLGLLDLLNFLPSGFYLLGFILAMVSSLSLLIVKLIKFKQLRPILRSLLGSYLLAIIPLIFLAVMLLIGNAPSESNIALIGLTAIPGFYFFSAYKTSLKQEFPRINIAMNLFTGGITLIFLINFILVLAPTGLLQQIISFSSTFFIGLTDFGTLLIMPALANDQINLFQNRTYSLRFSANRAAAFIYFILVISFLYVLAFLLFVNPLRDPSISILLSVIIAIIGTGLSVLSYKKFRLLFNRVILGIQTPPEELIHKFTQQITLSLNHPSLADLIKKQILPSLLIRESVILLFENQSQPSAFLRTGVSDENFQALIKLDQHSLKELSSDTSSQDDLAWIRLVLPLALEDEFFGLWFFGWRDPNNVYDEDFQTILKTLANQISITLQNIHQNKLLETLYNVNVERQEAEKAGFARDLHDVLLPSLGYLVELQNSDTNQKEFEKAVQQINDMVREIMSGLRPSSLDMGLDVAIEELADQPEAQIGGKIKIETDLSIPKPLNFDQNVELHLYRMVQQACHNAFEHAQAKSILISGHLQENEIRLRISDDGIGLPFQGLPNLNELLANHHFGLANIFERAKIIDATISIQSTPRQGTALEIIWVPDHKRQN